MIWRPYSQEIPPALLIVVKIELAAPVAET